MGNRGRPPKYPERNTAEERKKLIELAARLFEVPYDDRTLRDPDAPSLNEVARCMNITILKARKLLITADYYSTALSRAVQEAIGDGKTCSEVMNELNLSRASVNSYLPYEKGVYHLEKPSLYAEQSARYRCRRDAVKQIKTLQGHPEFEIVWSAVLAFEGFIFQTVGRNGHDGIRFTYAVTRTKSGSTGSELLISTKKKTVSKATVKLAYQNALRIMEEDGCVSGPKRLGVPGAGSYLYAVLLRIGVISRDQQ